LLDPIPGLARAKPKDTMIGGQPTVLGNYALPMMYGLLGAAAAAMMNVNQKIRSSRLSPRDRRMSQVHLVLGIITGNRCLYRSVPHSFRHRKLDHTTQWGRCGPVRFCLILSGRFRGGGRFQNGAEHSSDGLRRSTARLGVSAKSVSALQLGVAEPRLQCEKPGCERAVSKLLCLTGDRGFESCFLQRRVRLSRGSAFVG
jgi:hypothetical protein